MSIGSARTSFAVRRRRQAAPGVEIVHEDAPIPPDAPPPPSRAPPRPAVHRVRLRDAQVAALEAVLAVQLLREVPPDGAWRDLPKGRRSRVRAAVQLYAKLRRVRTSPTAGRPPLPSGPGLVGDLRDSAGLPRGP